MTVKLDITFIIYNIIEQACVCVFVKLFEKINANGVASVEPGQVREWIGIANLCQMYFRQIKKMLGQQKKTLFFKNFFGILII